MLQRTSLLEGYNRTLRRKLGQETLAEKLDAIRNGRGFRPLPSRPDVCRMPPPAATAVDAAVQIACGD